MDADPPAYGVNIASRMTIARAQEAYVALNALIPGKVAVWTTEHDPSFEDAPQSVPADRARFSREDLEHFEVAVVTHKFFRGKRSELAKRFLRNGKVVRRSLTVVDEQPVQVDHYDIRLSEAETVRESLIAKSPEYHAPLTALVEFMRDRDSNGATIEGPSANPKAWEADLAWFNTPEATRCVGEESENDPLSARVFGFARSLANGYAFIAKGRGGLTQFLGYQSNIMAPPGTMLLDATADIDGVNALCTWRKVHQMPRAKYRNLDIVHVPSCTKVPLTRYFEKLENRNDYMLWLESTVIEQMKPSQKGLVVCKKSLFDNRHIPEAKDSDDPEVGPHTWNLGGRKLAAIHWGTGIGQNVWREADVVFLFDEFHVPRRIHIANTQGLQELKASEGPLVSMKTLNSKSGPVDCISEGHLLRWTKQMATRGKARFFDGDGVCGVQKLVCTGKLRRLLENADRLFPEAKIQLLSVGETGQSQADKLYAILSDPSIPDEITTTQIGDLMGRPWRDFGSNIVSQLGFLTRIKVLNWEYVPKAGRGGSRFRRIRRMSNLENALAEAHLRPSGGQSHAPQGLEGR